jgi:ABC-2 type transport system permease protein
MKGFLTLLKKEIKEQIRTHRLLIVGGVIFFFALTSILSVAYLPELLKMAGPDLGITMPPVTPVQALAEFASNAMLVGIIVMVLIAMGSVAGEVKHGTALLTLSKPVSRGAFIAAKFVALNLTMLVSVWFSAIVSYAYTVWLIGSTPFGPFAILTLLLSLFLILCVAVTLLFSTLFNNSLAAGGMALGIIIAQAIFSGLPVIGNYFPGKLTTWGINSISGLSTGYWWALLISVILIVLCLVLAQRKLKNKEM